MNEGALLADQLEWTRDWTRKLIADLKGDDWIFQPQPGLTHVLWTCGHLASAQNTLIHVRCLGKSILEDAFCECFPIGGSVKAAGEFDYPSIERVLSTMDEVHRKSCDAVRNISVDLLSEPAYGADGKTPHPHYRDKRGAVSHCGRHEAFHAGQIAMLRRLLGKGFLR